MVADQTHERITAFRQQARINHCKDLWYVAMRALEHFARVEADLTKPRNGETPAPAYFSSTLDYRATLAGVIVMLGEAGAPEVAEALRLRIINEWGPDSVNMVPETIVTFIGRMHQRQLFVELPELDMFDWTALNGLVMNRGDANEHELRLLTNTELTRDAIKAAVATFRQMRAVHTVALRL